jgi:hypothetical protein
LKNQSQSQKRFAALRSDCGSFLLLQKLPQASETLRKDFKAD